METLFDPTTISTIVAGIIALILAVGNVIQEYQKKDKDKTIAAGEVAINAGIDLTKNIIKFFSSDVPMDAEQEALITTETVPAKTWKMDDANKDQLFRDLRNWGAEIRKGDLLAVIAKAEAESQVEYGIILQDHKGNTDRSIINKGKGADQEHEVYHAFVSYGNTSVQTYDDTMTKVGATSSKTYPLEIYWYMTDAEKEMLMSNIGYNNAKCITDAQTTIIDAEERQLESYYIGCGNHTFLVVKGNVTEMGANPKIEDLVSTAGAPVTAISN